MKLKNLFTCTVTGLLLCTSCIKDEAPNAEADILNCILPAEMLTGQSQLPPGSWATILTAPLSLPF